jgi:hypothetical protein
LNPYKKQRDMTPVIPMTMADFKRNERLGGCEAGAGDAIVEFERVRVSRKARSF